MEMSPHVVQLLKWLPVDSVNIPAESHRRVNCSVSKEQTEQALASHPRVYSLPSEKGKEFIPLSQECSDLNTSVKHLCALKGGLGKFFNPAGEEALLPSAGLLCSLVNQPLQQQGFI